MPNRVVMVRRWELIAAFAAITAAFVFGLWRVQTAQNATRKAVRENRSAVSVLCNQSFITAAVLQQSIALLKSEPVTRVRSQTIGIFQGYLQLFQERPECASQLLPPPPARTTTTKRAHH